MTPPLDNMRRLDFARETEPPLVTVAYLGHIHLPANLQVVPRLESNIRQIFSDPGKKILTLEDAYATPEEAKNAEKLFDVFGFQGAVIAGILSTQRVRPTMDAVSDRLHAIAQHSIDESVKLGLLPPGQLQAFYLFGMLDRIKAEMPFDFQVSLQPSGMSIKDRFSEAYFDAMQGKAQKLFMEGDFDGALRSTRDYFRFSSEDSQARDKYTNTLHAELAKQLLSDQRGGQVIHICGENHVAAVGDLRNRLYSQKGVAYMMNSTVQELHQGGLIYEALRKGRRPQDVQLMQMLISALAFGNFIEATINAGQLEQAALNYETLYLSFLNATKQLTIDQMRYCCQQRKHPYDIVLENLPSDS